MMQNITVLYISLMLFQEPQNCSKLFPLAREANNFTLTFQFYDRSGFLGDKDIESLMNPHLHCSFEGNFEIRLFSKECQGMKEGPPIVLYGKNRTAGAQTIFIKA